MSALQRMLGLDAIDFSGIGASVQQGIEDYNRKLDLIIANQQRILLLLAPREIHNVENKNEY